MTTASRAVWARWLGAGVLMLTPLAIGAILIFGGGQVRQCLGLNGCGLPQPEPQRFIGTGSAVLLLALGLGVAWFLVAALTTRYVWSVDRARLMRAAAGGAVLGISTAFIVGVVRLSEGRRLRVVAEDAGLWGLGALIVVVPLVLAWAVLTARTARGQAG